MTKRKDDASCLCGFRLRSDAGMLAHCAHCDAWQAGPAALRARVLAAVNRHWLDCPAVRSEPDRVPAWAPAEEIGQNAADIYQGKPSNDRCL